LPKTTSRWTAIQAAKVLVPDHVVFRSLAQETVLLNVDSGRYHGVDPIGARFFEVMCEQSSLSAAAEQLAQEYNQPLPQIESDLAAFCGQMEGYGLIELRSAV
jgi:hypothetical protein